MIELPRLIGVSRPRIRQGKLERRTAKHALQVIGRAVSCVEFGCAAADGAGITAAKDALALAKRSRVASEEISATRIAMAAAARTPARIRDEIEVL